VTAPPAPWTGTCSDLFRQRHPGKPQTRSIAGWSKRVFASLDGACIVRSAVYPRLDSRLNARYPAQTDTGGCPDTLMTFPSGRPPPLHGRNGGETFCQGARRIHRRKARFGNEEVGECGRKRRTLSFFLPARCSRPDVAAPTTQGTTGKAMLLTRRLRVNWGEMWQYGVVRPAAHCVTAYARSLPCCLPANMLPSRRAATPLSRDRWVERLSESARRGGWWFDGAHAGRHAAVFRPGFSPRCAPSWRTPRAGTRMR